MGNTDYLKLDHRKEILEMIISGFENSIKELRQRIDQIHWYDGGWFVEEVEPIFGLACIAYQNYINSSIYDKFGTLDNKLDLYKKWNNLINNKRSEIELIIALANYYKHRDDERPLHNGTDTVLQDLELKHRDIIEPERLPILKGVDLLSESWSLNDITKIVTGWRESLWTES